MYIHNNLSVKRSQYEDRLRKLDRERDIRQALDEKKKVENRMQADLKTGQEREGVLQRLAVFFRDANPIPGM